MRFSLWQVATDSLSPTTSITYQLLSAPSLMSLPIPSMWCYRLLCRILDSWEKVAFCGFTVGTNTLTSPLILISSLPINLIMKFVDAIVYEVVKSLGLSVTWKPVLSWQAWKNRCPIKEVDGKSGNYLLSTFQSYHYNCDLEFEGAEYDFLTATCEGIERIVGINGCQDPALCKPIMSALAYEPSLKIYYQSAAFLNTVH